MDPRITALKSTTFFGRRLTRRQIADIQETVALFPAISRNELGHTICEHLNWRAPSGRNRVAVCLRMLEELERLGILTLPARDEAQVRGPQEAMARSERTAPAAAIAEDLAALMPLRLSIAAGKEEGGLWNEFVARHHYLGLHRLVGAHLRYFLLDRHGRPLGCLLFARASRTLPCRDEWIGWPAEGFRKHLDLVVGHTRFLIFPWVRVDNLASKALSMALRQLPGDWEARFGARPVLVETFVDPSLFDGACYRAANWRCLGETGGGKGKTRKSVYVYPLMPDFRSILLEGPRPARRGNRTRPAALAPDDPFVALWQDLIGALAAVAADHDRVWQSRRRVLDTLLVMLFIFRLAFSNGRAGYATTLAGLWEQCRVLGVALPQPAPVSAMCMARAKVDEAVFKTLHAEILKRADGPAWKGHRVFAVDGSKLNLPRPLLKAGYRTPSEAAHYPQGLLSCLYRLHANIPVDFDLVAHGDERRAALAHLKALSANDIVVYDRGYYSWEMLHAHVARGLHPVFRIKKKAGAALDAFIADGRTDAPITVAPGKDTLRKLRRKTPHVDATPLRLRLVRYRIGSTVFILATTLLDPKAWSVAELAELYHARWGIEELYKTSKQAMAVEAFHSQTERGVRQELFAHFNLIAMTRLFTNRSNASLDAERPADGKPAMKANFSNGLATVARNLEALLLRHTAMVAETLSHVLSCINQARQRPRPGRSCERRSRKPRGKWARAKRAVA